MNVLVAKEIWKVFEHPKRVEVLKGVSLSVKESSSVAIMGASGEGKSTLLHILGTLDTPTKGTLSIGNQPLSNHKLRNQEIGFVFQSFNLLEDYTVLQNVMMPALIAGEESKDRAWELLRLVGLEERAHFKASLLSGGEKQRIAIARAFVNDPKIILADEPSGNLDHENSQIIHHLLVDAVKKSGKSLICVTHDQELANLCDQTYHLINGELK